MRKSEENNNNNINITNNDNNNDTTKTRIIVANGENDNKDNNISIVKASGNANKKRVLKEEDNYDEDRESDEPQKKARVVWSPDLHRKFVEAIHELGMDKVVPKKILEKMGVHDLTRENIASHLQKYRLYLKRLKEMPIQQENLLQSGFGSRNSQYTHLSSLESFKNYHASARYRQFVPLTSFGYGTNRSCAMSASSLPPLVASSIPSGYGTSVSNSNNNGILGSNYNNINSINNVNNVNNQTDLFMAGTATSTYSFQYLQTQCTNNGINYNYSSLPVPPAAQITNLPFAGSNISPIVMNTYGNLTGQNYTSETGDELQQVIASFNNSMQNVNHNTSALNSNLKSALFNPITKMNNSYVSVLGTNGEMGFGTGDGNGMGNFVPGQLSTSNNGSGFDSVDDLLAILKPMDGSGDVLFMDDILANLDV